MAGKSQTIADLVAKFRANVRSYKAKDYKEAELRQEFLDPFWIALGWDVGNRKRASEFHKEVVIEPNIETVEESGVRLRRPDFMFRVGGLDRFLLEAKKPSVNIDEDLEAIFQTKIYAYSKGLPFAILTDFEHFRLFEISGAPDQNSPKHGLIDDFALGYEDYSSSWDVFVETLGREAVEGGSLDRLWAKRRKLKAGRRVRTVDRMLIDVKGADPVDRVFLAHLDLHRRKFAADLYRHNKARFPDADTLHGAARLTEAVQRIMDRMVFMRVLEDRGIVPYGSLRDLLQRASDDRRDVYEALNRLFRDYDGKYNGYLFKEHFCEALEVDPEVLSDFTRAMYMPDAKWRFDAIGDDILGTVYERFLGNTIVVSNGHAKVEEKLEVRHAGGVYYTPRFVVDSIIRRVIGPKVQGKTLAEVLDVKILDPACGSGSFLVAALQYPL